MPRLSLSALAPALGAALLAAASAWPPGTRASDPRGSDWPMWGGSPARNMVSAATGLPARWDVKAGSGVRWTAALGSQTYGNPVVTGGTVYVGTNNAPPRDPRQAGDRGVLLALREKDGSFLWQMTHEKLASGQVNDWPDQGVCSSPLVEGDRVYYVSNRGEVMALDAQGFRDGENDGPVTGEALTGPENADVVWRFDMMAEVGSFPHNMSNSSPVAFGGLLYVGTSNGHDESHAKLPSPRAPSLIALDKRTGKLVWQDASPGERVLHGQWSSPMVARLGGVDQVVMGQGDGWVRGFEALTGKKLWEFDTNPKGAVWPKTRNEIIATPVAADGLVYLANGQDPEHGEGPGHLYAIDPAKRGDITESGRVWHFEKIRRSVSTAAVHDGVVYYPDFSGFLHAVDARTGAELWVHDMFASVWGSALVADGKVYLGDEDGDVAVLAAGREKKVLAEINMGSSIYSTPVPAAGVLYVATRDKLYALGEPAK